MESYLYILFFKEKDYCKIVREDNIIPASSSHNTYWETVDLKKSICFISRSYSSVVRTEECINFMFEKKSFSSLKVLRYDSSEICLFDTVTNTDNEFSMKIFSVSKLLKKVREVQNKKDDYIEGINTLFDMLEGLPFVFSDSSYGKNFLKTSKKIKS